MERTLAERKNDLNKLLIAIRSAERGIANLDGIPEILIPLAAESAGMGWEYGRELLDNLVAMRLADRFYPGSDMPAIRLSAQVRQVIDANVPA